MPLSGSTTSAVLPEIAALAHEDAVQIRIFFKGLAAMQPKMVVEKYEVVDRQF